MLYIIYSTSQNGIFGSQSGEMLWHSSQDLKFFKYKTTKHNNSAIIMGRKTADSLKCALPNRLNIVISSNTTYRDGFLLYNSVDDAIEWCLQNKYHTYIIGGTQLILYVLDKYIIRRVYKNIININNESELLQNTNTIIINDEQILQQKYIQYKIDNKDNIKFIKYTNKIDNYETNGEISYLNLLSKIYINGEFRKTRNGEVYSIFGDTLEFDVSKTFPLLTTKKMFLRGIFEELKFFLLGKTDTTELSNKGVKIWEGNTSRHFLDSIGLKSYNVGMMGPMYGYQWRNFNGKNIDQLQYIINELKDNPSSRRLLMTTFNPEQVNEGVLYPCHGIVVQFYLNKHNGLSCIMHQRSADMFLGVPFNIASYALLLHIICKIVNCNPHKLIINFGDLHIYDSHIHQVLTQLNRQPFKFPTLTINKELNSLNDINTLEFTDLQINNYVSHPVIKATMIA